MSRRCLCNAARQIGSSSRTGSHAMHLSLGRSAVAPASSVTGLSLTSQVSLCRSTLQRQIRGYATPTLRFTQSAISVEEYQKLSDSVFDSLTDYLEEVVQEYDGEEADDFEVEYSSGVLNLRLGDHGTYVINKQPANKQIWFSSPSSGPKRFDYDKEQNAWFMLKEGEEWNMRDLLNRELSRIFGRDVDVNLGER